MSIYQIVLGYFLGSMMIGGGVWLCVLGIKIYLDILGAQINSIKSPKDQAKLLIYIGQEW